MSKFHGDVSGNRTYLSTYLRKRDNGGSRAESREGAAKDFVVSRTFYSVSSGWRLLSVSQRTNSSSPSPPSPFLFSLSLYFHCPPAPSSLSRAPYTLLSKHSVIPSSLLLRFSENLILENFRLAMIFVSLHIFCDSNERPGDERCSKSFRDFHHVRKDRYPSNFSRTD